MNKQQLKLGNERTAKHLSDQLFKSEEQFGTYRYASLK